MTLKTLAPITVTEPPDRQARERFAHARKIKAMIESYWRNERKRYNVEVTIGTVSMGKGRGSALYTHRSNLVNGLPPPLGYWKKPSEPTR